jgi:hypothetical protein
MGYARPFCHPHLQITNLFTTDYQNAKKDYQKSAKVPHKFEQEDLDRGFIVTGLWSWSRHPNFAAEQTIWVVLYQWGCWSSDVMFNWTFAGAMSYLILFQASTWFTELVTSGKYPEYKECSWSRIPFSLPQTILGVAIGCPPYASSLLRQTRFSKSYLVYVMLTTRF